MVSANDRFYSYLTEAIGAENAAVALSALEEPASVSVRLNPFKCPPDLKKTVFPDSAPVPWSEYGLMLPERPAFTLDPLFHAGCYYVQDSSSMFVGHVLRRILEKSGYRRTLRVLDLCAAPGGKTTDAAASLREACGNGFLLVSNEVMKSRVQALAGNVAMWGDMNVAVTNADPAAFGSLAGFFDIILADVPCSGEGMFRKDSGAAAQWSEDNVALCAARQKRIIADVWPSLPEGGILIYSTCTFNRYENDDNVRWVAENLGAEVLRLGEGQVPEGVITTSYGYSLVPGFVEGEGQYCAALRKVSTSVRIRDMSVKKHQASMLDNLFDVPVAAEGKGGLLKALPEEVAAELLFLGKKVRVVSSGCAAGYVKGRDFIPDADLALCISLAGDAFRRVDVDRDTALAFLHRDALAFPQAPKGYLLVCHGGVPLGFVKNLGNRCNNLHPQDRRIRMDIRKI